MNLPDKVNVLGKCYEIKYVNNAIDVDSDGARPLFGQINPWTSSITVYEGNRDSGEILHTLIHEILHAISDDLHLVLQREEYHADLDILALAIADTLTRNKWLRMED